MREVTAADLEDIARGAAVLGTGGGGDPHIGRLMAEAAIRRHGPVTVVELDEVPDDAFVAMSAMMGAPTVMVEKIPGGGELIAAFGALQERAGRPITHAVCAEAGGLNSMVPFVTAATTGLPLVDADGMGRAFPEVQMVTPTLSGLSATPMALADDKQNTVVLDTVDNLWTERLARSICVDMGAAALIAAYTMSGEQAKRTLIPGTLRLAGEVGRTIADARRSHGDPIEAVLARLGGRRLFTGKVADVSRRTVAGFARGSARIEGTGPDSGGSLRIDFQNENLVAQAGDHVLASVPDLITVLEAESGEPITTEELRYGFRVVVVGAPCDHRWRTPAGLALVGPRYFGYDIDYVPVEETAQAAASPGREGSQP